MIFMTTFLYYVCFASTSLIYGIGLNRIADLDYYADKKLIYFLKIVFSIFISSLCSWLITNSLLVSLNLVELYPVVTFLVFVTVNTLIEGLIRISTGTSTTEFILSFIVVVLSVSEGTSLSNAMIISGSCLVAMAIIIPLVTAFRIRISTNDNNNEKYLCRFFIFISILVLIISCWDIAWLNPEVIQ